MMYKVKEQYGRTQNDIAEFNKIDDATLFVEAKLKKDYSMGNQATYLLCDVDVLQEFSAQNSATHSGSAAGQASGQASGQSFSPTPFQMTPRPGGIPVSGFKDVDGNKAEEKK